MEKNTFLTNKLVAHRGLHLDCPENSMPAFEKAIQAGYAIEMDVRWTKDKQLIVFHDETLLRLTGVDKVVADCTWEEISSLLLEGTEKIPLFSQFIQTLDGRAPLLLEIKYMHGVDEKEYIGQIEEVMRDYKGEYAVQSFIPSYVRAYKALHPEIMCGLLATAQTSKENFGGSLFWRIKAHVIKNMSLNFMVKPDFVSYCFSDLPRRAVTKFKGPKLGWTIRSEEDAAFARRYVDNLIFENFIPKQS